MPGVKRLSDSNTFKAAVAEVKEELRTEIQTISGNSIDTHFQNLPNEADGDPVPSTGLYISGDVVKVAG